MAYPITMMCFWSESGMLGGLSGLIWYSGVSEGAEIVARNWKAW